MAIDQDSAGGSHVHATDQVQKGGLAGTRGPHDGKEIARGHRKAHALQGRNHHLVEGIFLKDVLNGDDVGHFYPRKENSL